MRTHTHDQANEITQVDGDSEPLAHDRAGNLTEYPRYAGLERVRGGGYVAKYDAWNRLVKVQKNPDSPTTVATYAYDGLNRRIRKAVQNSPGLNMTYHFYYSGQRMIETRNGSDLVERYEYTPYGERQVYINGYAGTKAYVPSAMSNRINAGGISQPYGLNPFGHQGLMHDEESGLVYNRGRMRHTRIGRFLQRDPLRYVDGMSLYESVQSSPLVHRDPRGMAVQDQAQVNAKLLKLLHKHQGYIYAGVTGIPQIVGLARNAVSNMAPQNVFVGPQQQNKYLPSSSELHLNSRAAPRTALHEAVHRRNHGLKPKFDEGVAYTAGRLVQRLYTFSALEDELNKNNPDPKKLKRLWNQSVARVNGLIGDKYSYIVTVGIFSWSRTGRITPGHIVNTHQLHSLGFSCPALARRYNAHPHSKPNNACIEFICKQFGHGKLNRKHIARLQFRLSHPFNVDH